MYEPNTRTISTHRGGKKVNAFDFKLDCYGESDIGLVRSNNEDIWSALKEHGFFALADGMGGHKAGEVAAKEAVRFVCSSIEELFTSSEKNWNIFDLSSFSKISIENANSWVHHLGKKKKDYQGMGTTLCTLLFHQRSLIYGHVGDSRIYRFREGHLDQLTADHSLRNEMIAQGKFDPRESKNFPYKNVLTRAIGTHNDVEAEIHIAPVNPSDVYLMCTDGLTDYVDDQEIATVLKQDLSPEDMTLALIEQAKKRGGNDNITIVMIKVDPR